MLVVVVALMVSSSGCLSIDSVRESLLFTQEEPDVVYWKVTPPWVDVVWKAQRLAPADVWSETKTFPVKEGARWIKVQYTIELPSALVGENNPFNTSYVFTPEIVLRLKRPDNVVYWENNFTQADTNTFPIQSPQAGIWTLRIECKGYGVEAVGFEVRDSLSVVVDLYEPK